MNQSQCTPSLICPGLPIEKEGPIPCWFDSKSNCYVSSDLSLRRAPSSRSVSQAPINQTISCMNFRRIQSKTLRVMVIHYEGRPKSYLSPSICPFPLGVTSTWRQHTFGHPLHSRWRVWERLLLPDKSAGNSSVRASSNSLCCSLHCTLSSFVAPEVEVIELSRNTEEAEQTGRDYGLETCLTICQCQPSCGF